MRSFIWAAALAVTGVATASPSNGDDNESPKLASDTDEDTHAAVVEEPDPEIATLLGSLKTVYASEDVTVTVGGRIMFDAGWFTSDDNYPTSILGVVTSGNDADGVEFRRARLHATGKLYDTVGYKAEFDFANGSASFRDVWLKFGTRVGDLLVGHFKEPVSLEGQTSSRYITFMERALPLEAFWNTRSSGAGLFGPVSENWYYGLGVFRDTGNQGQTIGDGNSVVSGRLAGAIYNKDGGKHVLHVGASGRYASSRTVRSVTTRPEAHLLNDVFSTGLGSDSGSYLVGGEAAWVKDAFSLQGEYFVNGINEFGGAGAPDLSFNGFYFMGSWFITGEGRNYTSRGARFGRVSPSENWPGKGLKGAWELAARYSMVDFVDGAFDATVSNITGGLNWYMNPHTRIMLNYIFSNVDQPSLTIDDNMHALMLRFQVDF